MASNRTKSGLFETPRIKGAEVLSRSAASDAPRAKVTPTTPRAARPAKAGTPKADASPHLFLPFQSPRHSVDHHPRSSVSLDQSPRLSLERSPRYVDPKVAVQQRAPRISSLSDRRPRVTKESELQSELSAAQEQLRSTTDRLNSLESEKSRALDEMELAKSQAEEANRRLVEALAARRRAEEVSEIEKFRIVELEQVGIEAADEEAWRQELGRVRDQHSLDASTLRSVLQELQRLKTELVMTTEAKNAATSHADDALKIAEANVEKAATLSREIGCLKGLLETRVKNKETEEQVHKLESDIEALQFELDRAKESETKLSEMGAVVEGLRIEIDDARRAESEALALLDEWKSKAEHLEAKIEEAFQCEELALGSLTLATKKLEECSASLEAAEAEIASLRRRVELLELEASCYNSATEDSNSHLQVVKQRISESERTIQTLKSEMRSIKDDTSSAMENEKRFASNLPGLLEEKRRLLLELEASRDDIENTKTAMEGLAFALQEVSSEAQYSHGQLLTERVAFDEAKIQIDESKLAMESMEERYETMLIEAKGEVERLAAAVGEARRESEEFEWEKSSKEQNYSRLIRLSEEEIARIKEKMSKLECRLMETETEVVTTKEDDAQLRSRLMQAKLEAASANKAAEDAKVEAVQLKERLLDKENELQSISQENEDLRGREMAAISKIKELSKLLEEVNSKNSSNSVVFVVDFGSKPAQEAPNSNACRDEACIDKTEVCERHPKVVGTASPESMKLDNTGEELELNSAEESKNWDSFRAVDGNEWERGSLNGSFRSRIEKESFGTGGDWLDEEMQGKKKKNKNFLGKFKNLLKKKSSAN